MPFICFRFQFRPHLWQFLSVLNNVLTERTKTFVLNLSIWNIHLELSSMNKAWILFVSMILKYSNTRNMKYFNKDMM